MALASSKREGRLETVATGVLKFRKSQSLRVSSIEREIIETLSIEKLTQDVTLPGICAFSILFIGF